MTGKLHREYLGQDNMPVAEGKRAKEMGEINVGKWKRVPPAVQV